MNNQHHKTKETDITPFIVATFVVMVAILIAKVAGDLTKVTTSTSSRASAPTKVKTVKTLTPQTAYGDISCMASQKSWFGVCIEVNDPECAKSCAPNVTVADKTVYGRDICPGETRCVPLTIRKNFSFNATEAASPFCEKVTGQKGATCYSVWAKSPVKDIEQYEMFYAGENGNNTAFYIKKFNALGWLTGYKYKVECPIYITWAGGGVDVLNQLGGAKTGAVDRIESGYCYIPKPPTATPGQ
ncbi:MAG: hypothetical protein WAV30_01925 [Microgenomates group bacterium]